LDRRRLEFNFPDSSGRNLAARPAKQTESRTNAGGLTKSGRQLTIPILCKKKTNVAKP
jgi:hypothetical protein